MPASRPWAAMRNGSRAAAQPPGGEGEAEQRAERPERGQRGGRRDRQAEDLAAVGLQQDVLHREGGGAERDGGHDAQHPPLPQQVEKRVREARPGRRALVARHRVHPLLFPQRHEVEDQRQGRGALDDLDEADLAEIAQERAEYQRADRHSDEKHDVEQRHDPVALLRLRLVGGQRETRRLGHVKPEAGHHEGGAGQRLARPFRSVDLVAREQDQRERHEGEPAELVERAEPDERHPPPADGGAVRVGAEAEKGAEGRDEDRQRHHRRDQHRRHRQLDDHHAVEGAEQQDGGHADGDLEERQPQQTVQRQAVARRVRERKEVHPEFRQRVPLVGHLGANSIASLK